MTQENEIYHPMSTESSLIDSSNHNKLLAISCQRNIQISENFLEDFVVEVKEEEKGRRLDVVMVK